MGYNTLFHSKNSTYPKLIWMFLRKFIEFEYETLSDNLVISNGGLRIFEVKTICIIGDFIYK
ncbi:hypothetical protein SADUNF_Sadunf03G0032700 [Salix dunnii]|uniref:Uncharacterized protein n=1 Tax=Salix dunnii TaxID=1413687 RepID=A0A835KCU5_9ROSI|nr:hypothetical protein SADUNF_Sadunf03G0032700 [Salix dunnii]